MRFGSNLNKGSYRFTFFFVLFTTIFLIIQQEISGAPPTDMPILDEAAVQLLEELKTGFHAYESQFKSGIVKFTITVHTATKPSILRSILRFGKKPNYEEQGHWQVTYHFDEKHQFYDVKAHKKIELGTRARLPKWIDIHHQYLVKEKTLHVWEKIGTEWKQHPPRKILALFLEGRFNPQWWNLALHGSKRIFHAFKTVEIKEVEIQGTHHIKLSLYAPAEDRLHPNATYEIWIDPQKDYHVTRMIGYSRGIRETFLKSPKGVRHGFQITHYLARTQTTYQIKKYKPGIWFPKTVSEQRYSTSDLTKIFPDTPVGEVPLLMNEDLIAEDILAKHMHFRVMYTMQVEDAIFNIPIKQKDLPITLEK